MNINLELYRVFYTVAKYGSFSKAAEGLYISQSAVTQRISSLEKQFGCKLFYRMASGVKLTANGEKLFNEIENSMEIMSSIEDRFRKYLDQEIENKTIKIQTTTQINNVYIYNKMLNFLKKNPSSTIEIIEDANIKNAIEKLSNEEIDLVLFDYPYRVRKNDIEILMNNSLEQVLYASNKYLSRNKEINIYEDNDYRFILPSGGSFEREKINKYFAKQNIYINSTCEVNDLNLRKLFVSDNLGIALGIKDSIKKELEKGTFIEIPLKEKLPTYDIYIAKLKNNKEVEEFINIA